MECGAISHTVLYLQVLFGCCVIENIEVAHLILVAWPEIQENTDEMQNVSGNIRKTCPCNIHILKKVQVGNNREMKEIPTPQTEGWEKTKMTLRYLYQENIT